MIVPEKHQVNVYNFRQDFLKFTAQPDIFHRIAEIYTPRAPFRAMRRDHIFLFHAKRKIWGKESAPPDTMLLPAQLPRSLKRVVGFA